MADFDFMNNPNFGAPGGIVANQAAQMNALSMQKTQGEIEAQPTELALKQGQLAMQPKLLAAKWISDLATADLHAAEAGLKRDDLRERSVMAGVAMGDLGANVEPQNIAQNYIKRGIQLMGSGAPVGGMKVVEDGLRLQGSVNAARRNDIEAASEERKARLAAYDEMATEAAWVTDQAGLDRLNKRFVERWKEPPPWGNMPYSPALIQGIQRASLTEQQKAAIDDRRSRDAATESERETNKLIKEANLDIQRFNADTARQRADEARKRGQLREPNKVEIAAAEALLRSNHPEITDINVLDRAALEIAEGADRLLYSNPAIKPSEARMTAYRDVEKRLSQVPKDVKMLDPTSWFGKKTTMAIPMETDPTKRVVGQKYEQGNKVYEWTEDGGKKGWKEVK